MQTIQSRRRFLTGLTATGAAGLIGAPKSAYAEPPPETTTVRLSKIVPAGCEAPAYLAADLLRAEGFADVRYVEGESGVDSSLWLARDNVDFDWNYAAIHLASIEAGVPVTVLTGLHSGCLELIANDSVNSITDLKGKKVGVFSLSSSPHVLVTLMAAYVGLDPERDIDWIENEKVSPLELFARGDIDAFLAGPPEPQDLRARKIGHTILATTVDRPWSQYYCCMLAGAASYVDKNPVATKRVMRALLKAVDLCSSDAQSAAQRVADGGFADRQDFMLQTFKEARYDRWREFDPEDTLRFYALRMQETGMIKSNPNSIIAAGTDWSFYNELKRELKT